MSSSEWRDPKLRACTACGAQWPAERFDLVERIITAERRATAAEAGQAARARAAEDALMRDPDRSLVLALQARVAELEEIVQRQNERLMRGKSA